MLTLLCIVTGKDQSKNYILHFVLNNKTKYFESKISKLFEATISGQKGIFSTPSPVAHAPHVRKISTIQLPPPRCVIYGRTLRINLLQRTAQWDYMPLEWRQMLWPGECTTENDCAASLSSPVSVRSSYNPF